MKKNSVYLKILGDYIFLFLFTVFIIFYVPKMIVFFLPVVFGYIISLLANPIVRFLEERIKLVRKHGSAIVIIMVIGLVSVILYGIVYLVISQINNIIDDLPQLFIRIEGKINEIGKKFNGIINSMPKEMKSYIISFREGISFDGNILSGSGSFKVAKMTIVSVTNMLLYLIFTVMSAYYFTAERDRIMCRLRLCMPGYMMSHIKKVMQNFKSILGDYIKVQLKIMLILVVILYLAFNVFGIKYAFILSIVIGVLDLLPFLGTGCVLIPWALGAFILNEVILAIEILILYIICITIREVAEPKMFGKSIGLSAFATFFLLYIGLKLGGIIGVILAIPIGMIIINLYKAGAFEMLIENTKFLYYEIGKRRREIDDYVIKENEKRK